MEVWKQERRGGEGLGREGTSKEKDGFLSFFFSLVCAFALLVSLIIGPNRHRFSFSFLFFLNNNPKFQPIKRRNLTENFSGIIIFFLPLFLSHSLNSLSSLSASIGSERDSKFFHFL